MKRHCPALAVLVLAASLTGCAMCQNPFDYCGPVAGPGYRNCDFGARRGSMFAPMDDSSVEAPTGPTPAEVEPERADVSPAGATAERDTAERNAVDTLVR